LEVVYFVYHQENERGLRFGEFASKKITDRSCIQSIDLHFISKERSQSFALVR